LSLLHAAILGLVQGLTEFLPVSSSGHLALGKELLGIHVKGIAFEVFVHFGTFLAIVTVFRKDVLGLIQAVFKGIAGLNRLGKIYQEEHYFRWVVFIVIGSIPAGVIGVLFKDTIETAFTNIRMVTMMLLVTGVILFLTRFIRPPKKKMTVFRSILIGFSQALAILPGISRSGSTISVGMFLGIPREESARFSFLLALPVILGATVLKLGDLLENVPPTSEILSLVVGTLVAYISGYGAIKLLLGFVQKGKLDYFAYYCFAVGLIGFFLI